MSISIWQLIRWQRTVNDSYACAAAASMATQRLQILDCWNCGENSALLLDELVEVEFFCRRLG